MEEKNLALSIPKTGKSIHFTCQGCFTYRWKKKKTNKGLPWRNVMKFSHLYFLSIQIFIRGFHDTQLNLISCNHLILWVPSFYKCLENCHTRNFFFFFLITKGSEEQPALPKFVEGQTIKLEDGSTALLQATPPEASKCGRLFFLFFVLSYGCYIFSISHNSSLCPQGYVVMHWYSFLNQ